MFTKILVGLLVLGGVAFFIFKGGDKEMKNENTENMSSDVGEMQESENVNMEEDFNEKTTLAKIAQRGGNYECTVTHSSEVGSSNGIVYISGKKIRGDFTSKISVSGLPAGMGDIKTSMISDGESIYTWTSMTSEGYKVPVSEESSSESSGSVSTNQELDYKCVKWNVDESKFSLPTNITFKTI